MIRLWECVKQARRPALAPATRPVKRWCEQRRARRIAKLEALRARVRWTHAHNRR